MSEIVADQSNEQVNPMELAVTVSQRVQILDVIVAEASMKRSPDFDPEKSVGKFNTNVLSVEAIKVVEENVLLLLIAFQFTVTPPEETPSESSEQNESPSANPAVAKPVEPPLWVRAKFAVNYKISSFEGIEEPQLHAFATINGVFNLWPFWREHVHSMTMKMGIPAIVVPTYRLSQD